MYICSSMSDPEPKVGDEVAWNWGSSHIEGEVVEKTDKKITKQIKGKPITKNGEKGNPAYFVKQTQKKGIARNRQKSFLLTNKHTTYTLGLLHCRTTRIYMVAVVISCRLRCR